MVIYRLILTDRSVITVGDPWPYGDGRPMASDGTSMKDPNTQSRIGHVYMIVYVPETLQDFEEQSVVETDPAHYKLLMRADGGGGLRNQAGFEETQIYKIYADKVLFEGAVAGWGEALKEFNELLGGDSEPKPDLRPSGNSESLAQVEAAT